MNITIIDGQGGQLGAMLVKEMLEKFEDINLTVIGTNTVATATMLKAGTKNGATGENPVIVACRKSNVIVGPIGIVIADSLFGEITEKMAVAIGKSAATRILIPINRCDNIIAGVPNLNAKLLVDDAVSKIREIINNRNY